MPLPASRHPLDPRRSAQISTRRAKVRQKLVAFLDDMTSASRVRVFPVRPFVARMSPGSRAATRLTLDRAFGPCVRADGMRAESSRRPAVATADPLRRAGHAHLCGVRLRGSARLADVEPREGQLEDRVRSREGAAQPGAGRESVLSRSEAEVSVQRPDPSPRPPDARARSARLGSAPARARGRGAAPPDPQASSRRRPTT